MSEVVVNQYGAGGITFGQMISQLQGIAGVEVTDEEAKALLNEGYIKLVCESDYNRANLTIPITGAEFYPMPPSVYRVLKVWVNDQFFIPQDQQTAERMKSNELWNRGHGLWWIEFDQAAEESIGLYPKPDQGEMVVQAVVRPALLVDPDDEPVACPPEFRRAIIDYAAGVGLGGLEDDLESRQFHTEQFELARAQLRGLRYSKAGSGPRQVRVVGVHL